MSKTFAPRPAVRTNGRAANNRNIQPPAQRGGRVANNSNNSTSTSTQTQTNRGGGRGRGTGSLIRGRSRGAGPLGAKSRGSSSIAQSGRHNLGMDDCQPPIPGLGASSSPQRAGPPHENAEGQQGQYVGGFTKFEPNSKKRQQVSEMARKEAEEYAQYKQQNAMKYCNYVGTTGGGEITEDMARRKQANDVRNQKFNRLQNQQKRREDLRATEQREIDEKRAQARRKADENASNHYRDARPEDIRRKREDFLRQLESQPRAANATTTTTSSMGVSSSEMATSSVASAPRTQSQHQPLPPPSSAPLNRRDPDRFSTNLLSDSTTVSGGWQTEDDDKDDKKFHVEDFPDDVMTLAAMFPDVDMTYLNGLYKDAGSVDAVLDIIGV